MVKHDHGRSFENVFNSEMDFFFKRLEGARKIDGLVYFPFVVFAKNI